METDDPSDIINAAAYAEPQLENGTFENRSSILYIQLFQNNVDESSNYKNDEEGS